MTFSFKHESVPTEATRRYDLGVPTALGAPTVVLVVRHAGESNKGYWNAMFKRVHAQPGRSGAAAKITPEQLVTGRTELAEIYAKHVLVGWDNVADDGQPVDFTPDRALELLAALIDPAEGRPDVFDDLTRFCRDGSNFSAQAVDAAALGKR